MLVFNFFSLIALIYLLLEIKVDGPVVEICILINTISGQFIAI